MAKHLTAIYKDSGTASVAITRLHEAGISQDDISILMADTTRGREFTVSAETKAPEGTVAGGLIGGAVGAIAATLAAIGVIAAPGIGLVAAGPLLAALAGAGAGTAAGGLAGGLAGLGLPEHEVTLISEKISDGAILIGAHVHDDRQEEIKQLLKDTGGQDIRG